MMERKKLLAALKQLKVETGSLACLGCGYEHDCGVHGCAIIREAIACIADLEATHRTERCEDGYDCTELGKVRKALQAAESRLDEAKRYEWVSVKQRLPEKEQEVLLLCQTNRGYKYQCIGFYIPEGTFRDDTDIDWDEEVCDEYDEERGDYLVNSGWYEAVNNWDEYRAIWIADKVTHWMPLPEPPEGN